MRIPNLEDNLRAHIWACLQRGHTTGAALSRRAGFRQAHMSNFLNARRGLSLHAMDRLLDALGLDILDLVDPEELRLRALQRPEQASAYESVPLLSLEDAAYLPRIPPRQVRAWHKFRRSFLRRLKPDAIGECSDWLRFVLVRADTESVRAMHSRLAPGAMLLLDRHYHSLHPYHRGQANLYAVRSGGSCIIRYVALSGSRLVLRPHSLDVPVEVVDVEPGRSFAESIVGRVCHFSAEV